MATNSWNVDADGSWSTASNWSAGHVPQTGDDVVIDTPDFHTITFDPDAAGVTIQRLSVGNDAFDFVGGSGPDQTLSVTGAASFGNLLEVAGGTLNFNALNVSIASFEQDGGTISGTGTLTVIGSATVVQGVESGSGTTLLQGTGSAGNGQTLLEGGRTLENAGTFDVSGALMLEGATIKNDAGAAIDLGYTVHSVAIGGEAGFSNAFDNAGALSVATTLSSVKVTIGVTFTNTGTVLLQEGHLILTGGGSSSGSAFTIASEGALQIGGGGFTFTGGRFDSAGVTLIAGGTADFSKTTIGSFGAQLRISGGTLALGAQSVSIGSYFQKGGTLSGTGVVTLTGGQTFNNGNWDAETGSGKTLLDGATTDAGSIMLDGGRVLENAGVFDWTNGEIRLGHNPNGKTLGGATLKNDASATFDIEVDGDLLGGAGVDRFVNAGLLEKTGGTSVTEIAVALTNIGDVSVDSAALEFTAGGSSSASAFTVAKTATLEFGGGTFELTGGSYASSGLTEVSAGVLALGAVAAISASFEQSGGEVSGSGVLKVTGAAKLVAAKGAWDFESGAGTTLLKGVTSDTGSIALDGKRVLANAGTFDWTSGANIELGYNPDGGSAGGATIDNKARATFDIEASVSIVAYSGADAFVNAGLLELTGTPFTMRIKADFKNSGSVVVKSGTLDMHETVSGTGAFKIDGAANLEFDSSVASGERVTFTGPASGKLLLDDLSLSGSQLFHGKIVDFAKGDTIDAGAPFGKGTKFVFTENPAHTSGVLALTDGSLHASIDFIGKYAAADFHAHADGHGGTLISFS